MLAAPDRALQGRRFRPDLEGLRGVAILLVLLCHARVPGAGAGFVGVDVFFVLSGFLITGLLTGEAERTGRIGLRPFYARRARRILPAAIVVLASTLLAAQLVLSPLDVPRVADDVLAASLSVANVRFALGGIDYFAPVTASPVLHYWSLAVEEQFYLLWPAMLLLATRVRRPRLAMFGLMAAILAGSIVLCIALTATNGPWAYYSLPTRAWQLAAGGLLALAAPSLSRMPQPLASVVGWAGVGLLGASLVIIDPTTAYPGMIALLPTLAATALIASGGGAGSPGRIVLGRAPLRWLGRISYSLYLWHWPILVLGPVALGVTDPDEIGPDLVLAAGLVLLAVGLAALTWRIVEEPIRRGRLVPRERGRMRGFALAGVAVTIVVIGSTVFGAVAQRDIAAAAAFDGEEDPAAMAPSVMPRPPRSARPTSTPAASVASTTDPSLPPTSAPTVAPTPTVAPSAPPSPRTEGPVPRGLRPTLGNARSDVDPLVADGCGLSLAGSRPPACVYGDAQGTVTVALVGDSHAAHWFPAFEVLAKQRGWRLVPLTKHSCVFVDLPIWSPDLQREYRSCEDWREQVIDRLREIEPDLVVIASNRWLPVMADRDNEPERQGVAMARLIERIPATVAIIVDTPRSGVDVPACLVQHRDAIERCTTPRAAALTWRHLRRETEAARLSGATIIDLTSAVCPTDPCPPIIGKMLVYSDHHHLTATFVASLAPVLEQALPDLDPR